MTNTKIYLKFTERGLVGNMETINNIIDTIQMYKEDHPEVVITDEMIKDLINDYMKALIKEIKEEL